MTKSFKNELLQLLISSVAGFMLSTTIQASPGLTGIYTPASEAPYVLINNTDLPLIITPIEPHDGSLRLEAPLTVKPQEAKKIGAISIAELLNKKRYVSDSVPAVPRAFFIKSTSDEMDPFVIRLQQETISNTVRACAEVTRDPLHNSSCLATAVPNTIVYKAFALKSTPLLSTKDCTITIVAGLRLGSLFLPEVDILVNKK